MNQELSIVGSGEKLTRIVNEKSFNLTFGPNVKLVLKIYSERSCHTYITYGRNEKFSCRIDGYIKGFCQR